MKKDARKHLGPFPGKGGNVSEKHAMTRAETGSSFLASRLVSGSRTREVQGTVAATKASYSYKGKQKTPKKEKKKKKKTKKQGGRYF